MTLQSLWTNDKRQMIIMICTHQRFPNYSIISTSACPWSGHHHDRSSNRKGWEIDKGHVVSAKHMIKTKRTVQEPAKSNL